MIFSVKPVLAEDLCVVQKEELSICYTVCLKCTLDEKPSRFIRDKPIFSLERKLHKNYYRKISAEQKISGRGSQGAWRQDELIGGKLPVVKQLWLNRGFVRNTAFKSVQ
jgi:hypothetical protein